MIELSKLPPHAFEIEQSILSTILLNVDTEIIDQLSPDDFYKKAHSLIFRACRYLRAKNIKIDVAMVIEILKDKGYLEASGGAAYLATLLDTPIATAPEEYVKVLLGKTALRKTIEESSKIINECYNCPEDPVKVVDNAQRKINSIVVGGSEALFFDAMKLSIESMDRYEEIRNAKFEPGIPTGFYDIDNFIGGGLSAFSLLVFIAGRPRMGKTSLMLNMVRNMCEHGVKVGVFSLEMDRAQLDDRLSAAGTGINLIRLKNTKWLTPNEWAMLTDYNSKKSQWPMLIDDQGGLSVQEIKRRARIMAKEGCRVIFIDQLSKIVGDRKKSTFDRVTEIVEELGFLKKELRMPIVCLAQINRKAEERTDKRPTLADLKNTGQIEEEADTIFIINRAFEYTKNPAKENQATLDIAKNRDGPCKEINLGWDGKRTTFYNLEASI